MLSKHERMATIMFIAREQYPVRASDFYWMIIKVHHSDIAWYKVKKYDHDLIKVIFN